MFSSDYKDVVQGARMSTGREAWIKSHFPPIKQFSVPKPHCVHIGTGFRMDLLPIGCLPWAHCSRGCQGKELSPAKADLTSPMLERNKA